MSAPTTTSPSTSPTISPDPLPEAGTHASQTERPTARSAGRGGLAIAIAKVSFIATGFVQQLLLPRLLDVAGFGAVSRMLGVVSIANNVVVATSLQGVSRVVSTSSPETEGPALRATLRVHATLAVVMSALFFALAEPIASLIEARGAVVPLRVASGVVLCYGLYAPLVGALNGRQRFVDQAALDIGYGLARTALLLGGAFLFSRVWSGNGATGAAAGFVASAALVLPLAAWRAGTGRPGEGAPPAREYLRFLAPLLVAQLGLNVLLQTDLLLLSSAAGEQARRVVAESSAHALDAAALEQLAEKRADELLGVYRGVQLFGFLPYQLLMSIQFVLFPMLARARAQHDAEAVQRYVRTGLRLAFVFTGLVAGTIAALGPHVLRFAFPESIADMGRDAIRVHATGLGGLAILGVTSSALTSLGKERWSALLTWLTVALVALGCWLARPYDAFGKILVDTTATGTAIAMVVAAILGAFLLKKAAGAFVSVGVFVRVVVAMGVTIAIGFFVPWMGKLLVPVQAVGLAGVYVLVLVMLRELGSDDVKLVRSVVARRAQKA